MTATPLVFVDGLTGEQIEIVKSTLPVIQHFGPAIGRTFYNLLFEEHPQLRPVFDSGQPSSSELSLSFAAALLDYASNVDRIQNMEPAMVRIAHRDHSIAMSPDHYPMIGDVLLRAMARALGDVAQPEILDAWTAAYARLARAMAGFEDTAWRLPVAVS